MYSKKLYGTTSIKGTEYEGIKQDCEIQLEYYKTEAEIKISEKEKPYGIEVIKKKLENQQLKIETQVINNICKKENETNRLLEILMLNKVTPIGVEDVLADMISV